MRDRATKKSILRPLVFVLQIHCALQATLLQATSGAVKPGAFVSLKCYTDQRPTSWNWELNGEKLNGSIHYFADNGNEQVLKIPKFGIEYNGSFVCFPHHAPKSNSVTIYLTYPPGVRVFGSRFSAYETANVTINMTISYQGGYVKLSLVHNGKQSVSSKKFVYSKSRISLELTNVSRQMHGDWKVKLESHFADSPGQGVFYSSSFSLEIIRKPDQPNLSYIIASDRTSAAISWTVPAGNPNFHYDRIQMFRAQLRNSSGLFSYEFNASNHKTVIEKLAPGETVTFSIAAIGYHTQSDAGVVSISIECFGPHRPVSFIQSSIGQVYLNLSGLVYPVCLDSNSPKPKDSMISVERSRLINFTSNATDYYRVNLNWTKSPTEGKLSINSTSCPKVVSVCNTLLYLNASDKDSGATINPTTDLSGTTADSRAADHYSTAGTTTYSKPASTSMPDHYSTAGITTDSKLPTDYSPHEPATEEVSEASSTSLILTICFGAGIPLLLLLVVVIVFIILRRKQRIFNLSEASKCESIDSESNREPVDEATTTFTITDDAILQNCPNGTTSDVSSLPMFSSDASLEDDREPVQDERREPQAVPLPGVNVSVSLSEGNFKRFEAIMQKAVREGNQEHNDTLNDAMTKIESHCLAPPRLQTFQPASLP